MINVKIIIVLLIAIVPLHCISSVDFKNMRYLVNEEAMNRVMVISEFSFDIEVDKIKFTEETVTESGKISFASQQVPGSGSWIYIFNNMQPTKNFFENQHLRRASENGEYFFLLEEIIVDKVTYPNGNTYDNKFHLYDKNFNQLYEKGMNRRIRGLNNYGNAVALTKDFRNLILVDKHGNEKLLQQLRSFNTKEPDLTNYSPYFNNNGLIACYVSPMEEYTLAEYPLGARLFYFDNNTRVNSYIDIDGKDVCSRFGISNNKNYIIVKSYTKRDDHNSYKIHIYKNDSKVIELDGNLSTYEFSRDENIVLLNTIFEDGSGCYIVDLEKGKVIKQIRGLSSQVAIADKGNPIIAFQDYNIVYVFNYETNELLLKKWIGITKKRFRGAGRIQISGDGKQVSVFEKQWFKNFQIGTGK